MSSDNYKNRYWIPNLDINKKVITQDIQYYLGPDATVRPYTHKGEDGFLITTPGEPLTDEQVDDICRRSREIWEKQQAAARSQSEPSKQLKRPLHQPIVVSRGSKAADTRYRRHSNEQKEGSTRRRSEEPRYESNTRW